MQVRLTKAIVAEYNDREVFDGDEKGPFVPSIPGTHDLPRETLVEMQLDAEHWGNIHGDGVEDVPAGTRRVYRTLYSNLTKLLSA